MGDLVKGSPSSSASKIVALKNAQIANASRAGGPYELPPLQKVPGSRRGFSRGKLIVGGQMDASDLVSATLSQKQMSRAGSYVKPNNRGERVLFPT